MEKRICVRYEEFLRAAKIHRKFCTAVVGLGRTRTPHYKIHSAALGLHKTGRAENQT